MGPWQPISTREFVHRLFGSDLRPHNRPWMVAIDGRSGSGKSTLANLLHQVVPNSAVVHTDDVAWHHSFFDWDELMIAGILKPLHAGNAVCYQPPGWRTKGRPGSIELEAGLDLVIVEGVGASRVELMPWIDRAVWVQSDLDEAERRGIARDGADEAARNFWREWMTQEIVFLEQQRPWAGASLFVNGTPQQPHNPAGEVIVWRPIQ